MKITKFEQAGFIIESDSGYRVAMDIGSYTPLEKLTGVSVDAMFVSHFHGDHFSVEHIKKISPKKLYVSRECIELLSEVEISSEIVEAKVGETVTTGDFSCMFFDVDHGPNATRRPKENFGFLIEVDGNKIYFAGDMFHPSGIDVSNLDIDYALIPVGGFYTFGPQEALDFAKQFKEIKKLVPMHYEIRPEAKGEFLEIAAKAGIEVLSF